MTWLFFISLDPLLNCSLSKRGGVMRKTQVALSETNEDVGKVHSKEKKNYCNKSDSQKAQCH